MKVIDVTNKGKFYMRLVVENEEEAIEISLDFGHIKKRENATLHDVTTTLLEGNSDVETLQGILNDTKRGRLAWQGVSYSMAEIMSSDFEEIKKQKMKEYRVGYILGEYVKVNGKWTVKERR